MTYRDYLNTKETILKNRKSNIKLNQLVLAVDTVFGREKHNKKLAKRR